MTESVLDKAVNMLRLYWERGPQLQASECATDPDLRRAATSFLSSIEQSEMARVQQIGQTQSRLYGRVDDGACRNVAANIVRLISHGTIEEAIEAARRQGGEHFSEQPAEGFGKSLAGMEGAMKAAGLNRHGLEVEILGSRQALSVAGLSPGMQFECARVVEGMATNIGWLRFKARFKPAG